MSNTITGICRVNDHVKDNVVVYLYPASAPFAQSPPEGADRATGFAGTPFPSGGLVASTTSGPAHGGAGAYTFSDVPAGAYYAGYLFAGGYSWDSHAAVLASGVTSIAGAFSVSGTLTLTCPDNSTFLRLSEVGPHASGCHKIDAGPYYELRFSGIEGGEYRARHAFEVWDKMMTNNGAAGNVSFFVDADGQTHCTSRVTHSSSQAAQFDGVNHVLKVEAWVDGPPGVGHGAGIDFQAQALNGGGYLQGIIQSYWSSLTAGQEDSVMEFFVRNKGNDQRVVQLGSRGTFHLVGASGRMLIEIPPPNTTLFGLINIGDGGFINSTGSFLGSSDGTGLAFNMGNSFKGYIMAAQVSGASRLLLTAEGQLTATIHDVAASSVSYPLKLTKTLPQGTPQVGIGTGLQLFGPDVNKVSRNYGNIYCAAGAVTAGAINANMIFETVNGGTPGTAMTLTAGGKALFPIGIGVGNSSAVTALANPGTITTKIPVFDAAGNVLCYLAGYVTGSFS